MTPVIKLPLQQPSDAEANGRLADKPSHCLTGKATVTNPAHLHGGCLGEAVRQYNRPREQWLDLSTGINPNPWPVPTIPTAVYQRLPEDQDGLESAAAKYYQCHSLLPVAGSQAAIQTLPQLRSPCRVGLVVPCYNEHQTAWQRAGHQIIELAAGEIEQAIDSIDVLVLINPNNPDGTEYLPEQLFAWHHRLAHKGGWLIVDEAFVDSTPDRSLTKHCPKAGLIVLRSVGKFFGLAGIRAGFVCAEQGILQQLNQLLGPWTLTGPSRYLCTQALSDIHWQQQTLATLAHAGRRLQNLLTDTMVNANSSPFVKANTLSDPSESINLTTGNLSLENVTVVDGTTLFQTVKTAKACEYHYYLAQQGILTRLFAEEGLIRFGLPASDSQWQRLTDALTSMTKTLQAPASPASTTASASPNKEQSYD